MIQVDKHQCTGCGNCIPFCSNGILQLSDISDLNQRNVQYITIKDEHNCINCGQCELMCTAGAIKTNSLNSSGFDLIDKKAIPPHAGCYLGSLSKGLADVISEMKLESKIVVFKKKAADVNLLVETHDYDNDDYFKDAIEFKKNHLDKLVIIICSSSKEQSTAVNCERFLSMGEDSVTIINTLNWFEAGQDFVGVAKGGSHILEQLKDSNKASFIARGGVKSPTEINALKTYLKQAIECQLHGDVFSIVEIVFPCFYRLAGRPQTLMPYHELVDINNWFQTYVETEYVKGVLQEKRKDEEIVKQIVGKK